MRDDELSDLLCLDQIDHDDLIQVLSEVFPRGHTSGDRKVHYQSEDDQIGLTLQYAKDGRVLSAIVGPALSAEAQQRLRKAVAIALAPGDPVVIREFLFSSIPVDSAWTFRNDWQIIPAPPEAPRPPYPMAGGNPFLLEVVLEGSPNGMITLGRREKRFRELQLILTLVLKGFISRIAGRAGSQFDWKMVSVEGIGYERTAFLQTGYFVPEFQYAIDAMSDASEFASMVVADDAEFYAHSGITVGDVLTVPAILPHVLDAYDASSPEHRDRFLRACYWLDRGDATWSISSSLSYLAVCNAIEVLLEDPTPDFCPECGKDRAPGPTKSFANLIDTYAASRSKTEQNELYKLRSGLVHGALLLDADMPRGFGGLIPRELAQRDTHRLAREIARIAIMNFILRPTA